MLTNLVHVCPRLRVGKHVFSGQQPRHSMHIESGVNSFLPAFVILAREHLNLGDVWKGICIGRENMNWWCNSNGWKCDRWWESCSGKEL